MADAVLRFYSAAVDVMCSFMFCQPEEFFFGVFHRQEIGDFEGERLDIEIDDFLLTIVVPGSCGCDGLTCFATCKPGQIFGEI